MKFAVISKTAPTEAQIESAGKLNIELYWIGDANPSEVDTSFVDDCGVFEGAVVDHPATAMRLCCYFLIGVFEGAELTFFDVRF